MVPLTRCPSALRRIRAISWAQPEGHRRLRRTLPICKALTLEDMPRYAVTVTASYDAARAPVETVERLKAWAAAADGRTFAIDESIAPVRWTVTADYQVDAESDLAAEHMAVDRYADDADRAGITVAETVVAETGPLA